MARHSGRQKAAIPGSLAPISRWDFTGGNWLNTPSGLIRKDGSSKPVYDELLKLVKGEWWMAPSQFTADLEGKIDFREFYGKYELKFAGRKISFTL